MGKLEQRAYLISDGNGAAWQQVVTVLADGRLHVALVSC